MKFFSYIFTALAVSLLPVLTAANDHLNARNHHQGVARRAEGHLLDRRQSSHSRWSWYDTQTGNAYVPNAYMCPALPTQRLVDVYRLLWSYAPQL